MVTIVRAKREKGIITTVAAETVKSDSNDNNYQKAAAEYFLFIAEMEGQIK
jgi:hypothetical protein